MRKLVTVCAAAVLATWPALAGAQGSPSVRIEQPRQGSTVTGPNVELKVAVSNFTLVAAGTAVKAGEGHAHIFVDRDPLAAGALIPTDQPNIIHMGAAPFDSRTVQNLQPGSHTLHVVLADSSHKTLDPVASARVTFTVAAAGQASPPARPADTGDGSLADPGPAGIRIGLALGFVALGARLYARR